jgi:hypothetical protein
VRGILAAQALRDNLLRKRFAITCCASASR